MTKIFYHILEIVLYSQVNYPAIMQNVVFEYLDPGINDDITIGSNYLKPFRG